MIQKLKSRKLWLAVAAFLGALAAGVTDIANPTVCAICMSLSAGIYAACEAYVDGQTAKANQTLSTTNVTATADSKTVVENALIDTQEV